ncbi:MBL fold metallo-hydrolase [Terriglobus aquaticus]|uniref:MBL fold metallo-hydrolase n=1 Tax=Terriglobus aquaticus TaxID=940139 RepID=A0ABW9KMA0_9BACT|nr:MBL fold metallo-hydrolase [Terriglobus aquaticus]
MNVRPHPTVLRKLRQLYRVTRESYRQPLVGEPQLPVLVEHEELGITFIGHSSFLIQIGGRNLLVDPVFARALILLRRQRRPGLRVRDLPPIDAVLLSHAHMDHLHLRSLRQVVRHTVRITGFAPEAIVPSGVGDLVEKLGFRMVSELEWWQETDLRASDGTSTGVSVTMTPAKHWGARLFKDTHRLFGGYVIRNGRHSIYHSGDTAYFRGFREIGDRLSPQIALLPIGAYFPDSYRAVHTSPEEALQAFIDLRSAHTMIPMHFGTFPLGREPIEEPPVRLAEAARRSGLSGRVRILAEGETLRVAATDRSFAR